MNSNSSNIIYVLRCMCLSHQECLRLSSSDLRFRLERYTEQGYMDSKRAYKTPERAMKGVKAGDEPMSLYYTVGKSKIGSYTHYRLCFKNRDYSYCEYYFFENAHDVRKFLKLFKDCGFKIAAIVGDPEFRLNGVDVTADFLPNL